MKVEPDAASPLAPPASAGAVRHDAAREAERARFVQERLNLQVYTLGRATQAAAFAGALLLWGVVFWITRDPRCLVWAALVHSAQALRYVGFASTARRYPVHQDHHTLTTAAIRHVAPLLLVTSTAWAAAPWILTPVSGVHDDQLPLLAIFLFGMVAGSIPAIMPQPALVAVWLTPLTLSLALRFAWMGGAQGWIIAVATLLFAGAMARFALAQHRLLVSALRGQLEREELTAQLVARTGELQRLNSERSRFFASASHDLRQPVHALALFSRALLRDLQGHPAQPIAERVVQSTDAASGLLNAMLDISRIDAGAVVPRVGTVAVRPMFQQLSELFESRAHQAGLCLRFHVGAVRLETDGDLLLRILANFVDNALKYTARGGVLVSARARGPWLQLAVWDTGRGIAPDQMGHVFDEFYQVDNPQRDVARGLGIGLAIVRRLAQLLGGQVGVRSRVGRGSVFWIELPWHSPAQPAVEPPAPPPAAAAPSPSTEVPPPRVLLLDDELTVGEAVRVWLAPHCARIEVTTALAQARALVAATPDGFDAFIVDFRLADAQNGIEAAAELRQLAGRAVPTILVTGDTDPARVRAAYGSGLSVMFKPVQPDLLLQTLRQLIQNDRPPARAPEQDGVPRAPAQDHE